MRRTMGNKSTSTSTRQEHRTVAGAMLLVLILSLVCAQWLSHYRISVSQERFEPDITNALEQVELTTHDVDTLKLQLPGNWKQQGRTQLGTSPGVVREAMFVDETSMADTLHVFELDAGQTQDPQAVVYASIRHAVDTGDLPSLSIAHQWGSRRSNRMIRRLLAISRTDGSPVLHHLMIWTHDGRYYWVFYARQEYPGQRFEMSNLIRFDKLHTPISLLAQDTRYSLATPADCATRQLGYSASLTDDYATCDPRSPGTVLLYPDTLDGFCVIRVSRSAQMPDEQLGQTLAWQFEGTMHRQPDDNELIHNESQPDTNWWTLQYPAEKDMGIGPEPLSRMVHVITLPEAASLTVEVTGNVDSVKQASSMLLKIIKPLATLPGYADAEQTALQTGSKLVDYSLKHLKTAVKNESNVYRIRIANQPVGYQLESITREDEDHAHSQVHIVFPATGKVDAYIDHVWTIDFAQNHYTSVTQDHNANGSVYKRSLSMMGQNVICESDILGYADDQGADIPWPVAEDYWPVTWMTQQDMLDQWMLIRTAYAGTPPALHWVRLQAHDEGYRLLRRPIHCVDSSVYELDAQGNFLSLDGYDFTAGPTSSVSLSVDRVKPSSVYNQWPAHKTSILKWISDHEPPNH